MIVWRVIRSYLCLIRKAPWKSQSNFRHTLCPVATASSGPNPKLMPIVSLFFLLTLSQNADNSVSLPFSHETRHSLVYAAISARSAGRLHPRLKDFLVSDKRSRCTCTTTTRTYSALDGWIAPERGGVCIC
ncbi:hypothetical protein BDV40DRAFT_273852 [Aspergillus tamarii]|uniref:Uncharacterized protein n=1 Tax=Aspergillus tamarii TaxID=41984 RepID=A0A5N6UKQ4_ASPTM|nr:hypothetical protein BDV40DRAFT_273852 [Aspergillus tamarii]